MSSGVQQDGVDGNSFCGLEELNVVGLGELDASTRLGVGCMQWCGDVVLVDDEEQIDMRRDEGINIVRVEEDKRKASQWLPSYLSRLQGLRAMQQVTRGSGLRLSPASK